MMSAEISVDRVQSRKLSKTDKQILKVLLEPAGKISTSMLAEKLDIPITTVQRRRRHLERKYLEVTYSLRLTDLGYRRIDFFLYIGGGNSTEIGRELLAHNEVVSVSRSVGEHTIDLRVEVIVKDTQQLLRLLEIMKSMPDVKDVIWSETAFVIGRKRSVPSEVIDDL